MVLILTGPTRAGKNAIALELASRLEQCAVIDVDLVRAMVVNPHRAPWQGQEGAAQRLLGVRNACLLAANFAESGYVTIVLDVLSDEMAQLYGAELKEYEPRIVLLLPTLDEIKARCAKWGSPLTDDEVLWTYREQQRLTAYDEKIDNTHLDPGEVAGMLARLVAAVT